MISYKKGRQDYPGAQQYFDCITVLVNGVSAPINKPNIFKLLRNISKLYVTLHKPTHMD